MKQQLLSLLLTFSALASAAPVAWGHAVQTDYYVDLLAAELSLELNAAYSTGEPMAAASVTVYAPGNSDTPWLESQTDTAGGFTFLPDASLQGKWRIEFTKDGHQDILIVPVTDGSIDYSYISRLGNQDIHYAQPTPVAIALGSVVGIGLIAVSIRRKLRETPHM